MRTPVVLALVVVVGGICLALGTLIAPGREETPAAAPAQVPTDHEERCARAEERLSEVAARLAQASEEVRVLRAERDALAAEVEARGPAPGAEPAPAVFCADRYGGVLGKVDWKAVGASIGGMTRLIGEIVPELAAGRAPDRMKVVEIQRLNTHLLQAAVTAQTAMPDSATNGAFSDPAFMVNAMASTLAAVDLPLSEAQARQIERVARDWLAADDKRRSAYDETTLTVVRLYEEAEIKDGFFRDAFAVLTPEQSEVLSPPVSRGRVRLDLFSSALIYVGRVRTVPFRETKEVVDFMSGEGLGGLALTPEERARTREVVSEWLAGIPPDLLLRETTTLDLEGMVHTDRVTAWARHEVDLVLRLARVIEFDEKRTAHVRAVGGVAVPVHRPAEKD